MAWIIWLLPIIDVVLTAIGLLTDGAMWAQVGVVFGAFHVLVLVVDIFLRGARALYPVVSKNLVNAPVFAYAASRK